jgi:hypothetical protein
MRTSITAARFTILGTILTVFLTASALRAQAPQCSNDTMKGVYVMQGTGTVVGIGPVEAAPAECDRISSASARKPGP